MPLLIVTHIVTALCGFLTALLLPWTKKQFAAIESEERKMGFKSFLEKVGEDVKSDFGKMLPVVIKAAQIAEPVIDLALPAVGPEYNLVVNAVVATEQGYAALGVTGTQQQKVAAVLTQVESTLLPALQKAGLDSATATAVMTQYITAIATILSGPLSGAAATASAAPSAPAAPAVVDLATAQLASAAAVAQSGPGLAASVPQ